jgi:hypothetical protein
MTRDEILDQIRRDLLATLAGPVAERRAAPRGPVYRRAVHEAAHAVVARIGGFQPWELSIFPQDRTGGHIVYTAPDRPAPSRQEVDRWLAKPLSEAVIARGLALVLAPTCDRRTVHDYFRAARRQAEDLISGNWAAIEALAEELSDPGCMDAASMHALLDGM